MIIGSHTLQIDNGTLWYRKLLKAAGQGDAVPDSDESANVEQPTAQWRKVIVSGKDTTKAFHQFHSSKIGNYATFLINCIPI